MLFPLAGQLPRVEVWGPTLPVGSLQESVLKWGPQGSQGHGTYRRGSRIPTVCGCATTLRGAQDRRPWPCLNETGGSCDLRCPCLCRRPGGVHWWCPMAWRPLVSGSCRKPPGHRGEILLQALVGTVSLSSEQRKISSGKREAFQPSFRGLRPRLDPGSPWGAKRTGGTSGVVVGLESPPGSSLPLWVVPGRALLLFPPC